MNNSSYHKNPAFVNPKQSRVFVTMVWIIINIIYPISVVN